jgi:hypothetical protein
MDIRDGGVRRREGKRQWRVFFLIWKKIVAN